MLREEVTMAKSISSHSFPVLCLFILLLIVKLTLAKETCGTTQECEEEARTYLRQTYEPKSTSFCNKANIGEWNYETNLNSAEAEEEATKVSMAQSKFEFQAYNDTIKHWDWKSFSDEWLKRQLMFLNFPGVAILNSTDLKRYNDILAEMSKIYGTAKICPFANQHCDKTKKGLDLEPEIENIMATSRNYPELSYTWTSWRDATGKKMREMYSDYIDLGNEAATLNGFNDTSGLWLFHYESDNFKDQMKQTWNEVKKLYEKLYGYTRYKLRQWYPYEFKNEDDPIPAHILGNMWAQQWSNIYDIVKPFPDSPGFDVTEELKKRFGEGGKDAVIPMFKLANKFFIELGLADMKVAFSDKAVLVRPNDREVVCHASAWDFCDGKDYRIKMCTKVDHDDLITIHHELGHIQYFMQYSKLPITFREGANPGFHEAIGDVLALSVATTKHMIKLGLMEDAKGNLELTLNYLMKVALEKIAFLPFGYCIDAYRWKLFDGSIPRDKMTAGWLKMRNEIQGLIPPVKRTEHDFDPGAKFHVPGNTPYIRYFFSFIVQFQIHKALCIKAGEYAQNDPKRPLHNCDIDGNLEAGAVMKELLKAGASKNWQDVLEKATGNRELSTSAIKEYFLPLFEYLDEQQEKYNYSTKWRNDAWLDRYGEH